VTSDGRSTLPRDPEWVLPVENCAEIRRPHRAEDAPSRRSPVGWTDPTKRSMPHRDRSSRREGTRPGEGRLADGADPRFERGARRLPLAATGSRRASPIRRVRRRCRHGPPVRASRTRSTAALTRPASRSTWPAMAARGMDDCPQLPPRLRERGRAHLRPEARVPAGVARPPTVGDHRPFRCTRSPNAPRWGPQPTYAAGCVSNHTSVKHGSGPSASMAVAGGVMPGRGVWLVRNSPLEHGAVSSECSGDGLHRISPPRLGRRPSRCRCSSSSHVQPGPRTLQGRRPAPGSSPTDAATSLETELDQSPRVARSKIADDGEPASQRRV
jgi:hypothetical protein